MDVDTDANCPSWGHPGTAMQGGPCNYGRVYGAGGVESMLHTNLNEILVFMAVVDAGSFISAVQAIGLTRSAAGKDLVPLEDRLGVRLLNRTTRTLSLTDEGRVFYQRALQILAAVDDAEASVAGAPRPPPGPL